MSDMDINVAMNLREWRIQNELTLEELAKKLGLSRSSRTLARIELGENGFDSDFVELIEIVTKDMVTVGDMHKTRLAWLRENRPMRLHLANRGAAS